ncbi:MAG: aminoacyl-tRNA hydrolase [Clostridiaceae bacterium]|nr:aminoacyl-tRNA hydrolase [Clostridiaceae bacterium]
MYLIVGLGNPGAQYAGTRHNVGFEVIDYLSSVYNINMSRLKHKALIGEGFIQGNKVILAKPQTYMNLSGESVRDLKEWYKLDNSNIIVIYDDISLQLGRIRIRAKGSDGGHNGVKSIIYQMQSDVFPRIKIGIGQPSHPDYDLADYVLGKFSREELEILIPSLKKAAEAVPVIIQAGVNVAMNKFNGNGMV